MSSALFGCLLQYRALMVKKLKNSTVFVAGLSIHTFHGNFFVRSTDLLSLPNINPDAGFGMQLSIEDTIESNFACFQAALLYTSSKGECGSLYSQCIWQKLVEHSHDNEMENRCSIASQTVGAVVKISSQSVGAVVKISSQSVGAVVKISSQSVGPW